MPATQAQIDYIDILANDVGFDTRLKKWDFISNFLGYKINDFDEMAIPEASQVIAKLREYRSLTYELRDPREEEDED